MISTGPRLPGGDVAHVMNEHSGVVYIRHSKKGVKPTGCRCVKLDLLMLMNSILACEERDCTQVSGLRQGGAILQDEQNVSGQFGTTCMGIQT